MEKFQYIPEVIIEFENLITEFGGEVIPCTQHELDNLESMLIPPYRLPAAYKEFLLYGGKKIAKIFESGFSFSYDTATLMLQHGYRDIINMVQIEDKNFQLPTDLFILNEHLGSNFSYFLLTEGNDPPIYYWEEGEGGLEVSQREFDSFSDFLINEVRLYRIHNRAPLTKKMLEARKPPRGRFSWNPTHQEYREGIDIYHLMQYFGFSTFDQLAQAANLSGLNSEQYLEEISGWYCRSMIKNDKSQILFFPTKST